MFTLSQLHSYVIFYSMQSRDIISARYTTTHLQCAVTALVATFPMPTAAVSLKLQQQCNVQADFQYLSLLSLTINHICRKHRTHNTTHNQSNFIHRHYFNPQLVAASFCSFVHHINVNQSTLCLHTVTDSCQKE